LAQGLRDAGAPLPAALVLFSPWLDLAVTGEDQPTIERSDPALSIAFLRAAGKLWARDQPLVRGPQRPAANDRGLPAPLTFSTPMPSRSRPAIPL